MSTQACLSRILLALPLSIAVASCGEDGSTGTGGTGETDTGGGEGDGDGGSDDGGGTDGGGDDGSTGGDTGGDTGGGDDGGTDGGTDDGTDGETGGGDDGGTGTGDDGDTGTGDPPPAGPLPDGEPGEWVWVDIDGAECRDGSQAGLAVRYSDGSDNLMVYLEGGGACFNALTCGTNPSSADMRDGGSSGIFDTGNEDNPVGDWNHVFIPYCTGDIFAGDNPGANVPGGPSNQQFVGYDNVGLMLDRIVPTFPDAEQVLLTGGSAGGFGAAYNFDRAQKAFGDIPLVLLDDSGPPLADEYMAPCLQQQWRDIWGLDSTLPADCDECFHDDGGGLVNMATFIGSKYADRSMGLISSEEDETIRSFYAFGLNDCTNPTPIGYSASMFTEGLYDLRDNWVNDQDNWGSFAISGSTHTWLTSRFYETTVDGVAMTDWVGDLLEGSPSHVSP